MKRRIMSIAAALLLCATSTSSAIAAPPAQMPASPIDESKVPHYFGPYPNWANSPQVLADAIVTISGGGGTGATATATVLPGTGAIGSVTITVPGSGYTSAPTVVFDSPGVTPSVVATATAVISTGVVTSIAVAEPGFGFTTPAVNITGGGVISVQATATASGGVDNVTLVSGGTGYTVQPIVVFSLPNLPAGTQATGTATMDTNGVVTGVTVVSPGSGYTSAPTVTILDGIAVNPTAAVVTATIGIGQIDITAGGAGYDSTPAVTITDSVAPFDKGATTTATVAALGSVSAINVTLGGAGYLTPGLKKFIDPLPGLCDPAGITAPVCSTGAGAKYIPLGVPDTQTYAGADYYEIAAVQYREKFSSLMPATLLRGYVQLSTSVVPGAHVPLSNANLDPNLADTPIYLPDGSRAYGVEAPHYLGPTIVATKNKPVRVLFRNLLPTGVAGDLFLPVDTTIMGAGPGPDMVTLDANNVPMPMATDLGTVMDGVRNPVCGETPKPAECYSENRATLHLHGGVTPWISDGTPHQWTTPAGEATAYPEGVSVSNVPDMPDPGPGAETFFYTNQQSARLMFYHDHAWGITRLNVYAGEAAGYLVTDATEQSLIAPGGALAGLGVGTPLVIEDKTFVPANIAAVDPTWDASKWGGTGSLWTPHVYMPAQNPGDPTGSSPLGRWMYGPWFWPPAKDVKYPPIANPYYDPTCDPNVQPFCEPALIPSTPNVSVGMEAFNDTPIVNGTAYPTTTVDPKAYRYRILNAANDRFWNLQWYVADPTTGTLSEVALNPTELAAAQTNPDIVPTPDLTKSPAGPSWIQIGTEGGFLPAPVVVANQPITWIVNPTRFDFGNVDKHALLLAPAERADVIVDFSQYRGKTLILYNDAPAAFPARQANMDYYTGGPDMTSSGGAPTTLPGYGPNTRTIMQVTVSNAAPDVAFDRPNTTNDRMGALVTAFAHHADGSGVFESSQDPIIVGQAAYNSTYGSSFVANGYCTSPTNPSTKCDGFARIQQQGGDLFKFDTLGPTPAVSAGPQLSIPLQPKALHDEMNSANFDDWGRMTANMGLEAPGATPLLQNIILYPFVNPVTEALDATGLPSSLNVTVISSASDGTQIWKITHNGVDTHPIHFHLYDVQVINRVTWDNIIMPPDANELGWKETVRVSPLEDTIVAVRPIVPVLPFGVMDSYRPLNPAMPIGARGDTNGPNGTEAGFNNTDANGNPIAPIVNVWTDFGWEYVWHCHILSHEEMDMMRPVTVHVARALPDAPVLTFTRGSVILNWTDGTPVSYTDPTTWGNPKNEVGYRIERAVVTGSVVGPYTEIGTALANITTYTDIPADPSQTYDYRVTAWNAAGDSVSNVLTVPPAPGVATHLAVSGLTSPRVAGTPGTITVTALDASGNVANGYLGTIHFTSTDRAAILPADYTFPGLSGTQSFSVTLNTAGTQAVRARDTVSSSITGLQTGIVVTPGPATHFIVSGLTTPRVAGTAGTITVTAYDAFGNTATGYRGIVHFTSTDGAATLPANYTFTAGDSGVHTFSVTLKTVGTQAVRATDTVTSTITGLQIAIVVTPGAATRLAVSGLTSPRVAGTAGTITVTAKDASGNTATGYRGIVHFTSTDPAATLPANYTFTAGDAGVHTFSVTLKTVGTRSVTATDTVTNTITGVQTGIVVTPAAATTLSVSGLTSPRVAGTAGTITVTAKDAFGNTATGYRGIVHFTSTDPAATLPANYTFTAGDAGVHTFSVTLKTVGTRSVTATDTVTNTITGVQTGIVVTPAAAATFVVSGLTSPRTHGIEGTITVTAKDAFGNTATGYRGIVHFTSTDGVASLPANYTFTAGDAGVHSFSITLKTVGTQAVRATDTVTSTITGLQTGIVVN